MFTDSDIAEYNMLKAEEWQRDHFTTDGTIGFTDAQRQAALTVMRTNKAARTASDKIAAAAEEAKWAQYAAKK